MAQSVSVLVVGAGPVGLAAAIELHRRGVPVRIVDQDKAATSESRAVAVNPRTLDLLEASGASRRLIAAGIRLKGFRIIGEGRTLARIHMDRLKHRHNFMLALPQDKTEAILADCLSERGIPIERGITATEIAAYDDHAVATLIGPDGAAERVDAGWIIGADGAHSTVRKALDIGFPGASYPFEWSLADVDLSGDVALDQGEIRLDPHKPMLFRVPIGTGRHRLIANGPNVLGLLPPNWHLGTVHWESRFKVSHRQVERLGQGRVRLIGDAAHIHSPAGGRGMNLGIEDAATLAERLAARDLGDWDLQRQYKAAKVIRESDRMQDMATADGPFARRAIPRLAGLLLALPPLHARFITTMAGLA
jgi:2-polyprenyl-6-methoxyphenol hydroxylase-like FAD-dependent oxidoreductase